MANIKSQIKRNRQNEKRRLRNRVFRGSARVAVRDAMANMEAGDPEDSRQAVMAAISALDRAAEKGVIHRNNAARRKGRLMKRLSAMGLQASGPARTKKSKSDQAEAPEKAAPKKAAAAPKSAKKPAAKKPAAAKATKKPAAAKTSKKSTATKSTKKTATKKTTKK